MPLKETPPPGANVATMSRDTRAALLCACLVVFATLATLPFLEMGVNDDWSYSLTARDLAATGRLVYNGWATVLLGIQAYWAALWITLFGFSFTVVRLSTLPLAAGCAVLIYALCRQAALGPSLSVFGTLAVVLSPVFLPLAASFMTDVPGLFFLLLCLYGCARVLGENPSERGRLGWLALAAAAGLLGGTTRQIVWVAALALLPYVAWRRRRDRQVVLASAGLWALSVAAILACILWFRAQPYALPERPTEGLDLFLRGFPLSLATLLPLVFTTVLLALPVLLGTATAWRSVGALGLIPIALVTLLWIGIPFLAFGDGAIGPWLGNLVTRWGVFAAGEATIGTEPETLPLPVRILLSLAVYGLLAVLTLAAFQALRQRRAGTKGSADTLPPAVPLLLVFVALYLPLLTPRAAQGVAFDRYLIPVLPVVAILALRRFQRTVGERTPPLGWALVGVFGLYGIAATHDYLAASRARLAAANALVAAGVPRTRILAGLEYDGGTEVAARGFVNDRRIENPPGVYQPPGQKPFPMETPYAFWQWTPSITPRYFVVLSPQKELAPSPFPSVPYTAWLPPFRREVHIQMVQ